MKDCSRAALGKFGRPDHVIFVPVRLEDVSNSEVVPDRKIQIAVAVPPGVDNRGFTAGPHDVGIVGKALRYYAFEQQYPTSLPWCLHTQRVYRL